MYSLDFPNMFSNTKTNLIEDHEATYSNLRLLLLSEKTSLFGDPYFGTLLKRVLYEQNSVILQDLIIDEIYTAITIFMPQIRLKRSDITVTSDGVDVYATIRCINLTDYVTDLYTINLTTVDEVRNG